ncbi:hypothetical protein FH972_021162 [Carpinus fangiana]|uniref:Uncharacterized protein n=1 Tax=Carpinus fangiana TaxID=176857 RepID=A0A5N6KNQ7_9ROSI|nr:hypothetical protein FH972_021162 [Carpinus fangiana]
MVGSHVERSRISNFRSPQSFPRDRCFGSLLDNGLSRLRHEVHPREIHALVSVVSDEGRYHLADAERSTFDLVAVSAKPFLGSLLTVSESGNLTVAVEMEVRQVKVSFGCSGAAAARFCVLTSLKLRPFILRSYSER